MKRRIFDVIERPHSEGGAQLAKKGDWYIEENLEGEVTGILGRFSYLAASVLASELEQAVTDFIEDNSVKCGKCGESFIDLSEDGAWYCCPFCGLKREAES